jgi:hypothetical protein
MGTGVPLGLAAAAACAGVAGVRFAEFCKSEVCAGETCADEICPGEICADATGANKIVAAEQQNSSAGQKTILMEMNPSWLWFSLQASYSHAYPHNVMRETNRECFWNTC